VDVSTTLSVNQNRILTRHRHGGDPPTRSQPLDNTYWVGQAKMPAQGQYWKPVHTLGQKNGSRTPMLWALRVSLFRYRCRN